MDHFRVTSAEPLGHAGVRPPPRVDMTRSRREATSTPPLKVGDVGYFSFSHSQLLLARRTNYFPRSLFKVCGWKATGQ